MYPALAVLQVLGDKAPEVLWIGNEGSMEAEILTRQSISFATIPAAGLHGVGLFRLPGNLYQLLRGFFKARRILADFKPDIIFYTGGFLSIPVSLASHQIPSLVFVPDIEPGSALKLLIKHATAIAVSTKDSLAFLPSGKRAVVTGYPVRPELKSWTQNSSREKLNLSSSMPVLLVFGGSKGSQSINRALYSILPELLKVAQVVHISGQINREETQISIRNLPKKLLANYHGYSFLHSEMGAALASADLAVCRAGASTLGELPSFGLPAILVPYPHAWKYQHSNAEYLVKNNGAVIVEDSELEDKLLVTVLNLLNNQRVMKSMKEAMLSINNPNAAKNIGELIFEVGGLKGDISSW